jgi:hypothetical protein
LEYLQATPTWFDVCISVQYNTIRQYIQYRSCWLQLQAVFAGSSKLPACRCMLEHLWLITGILFSLACPSRPCPCPCSRVLLLFFSLPLLAGLAANLLLCRRFPDPAGTESRSTNTKFTGIALRIRAWEASPNTLTSTKICTSQRRGNPCTAGLPIIHTFQS